MGLGPWSPGRVEVVARDVPLDRHVCTGEEPRVAGVEEEDVALFDAGPVVWVAQVPGLAPVGPAPVRPAAYGVGPVSTVRVGRYQVSLVVRSRSPPSGLWRTWGGWLVLQRWAPRTGVGRKFPMP